MKAHELKLNDHFSCWGRTWKHCGWHSAVEHICAEDVNTKEHKVISCHEMVKKIEVKDDSG